MYSPYNKATHDELIKGAYVHSSKPMKYVFMLLSTQAGENAEIQTSYFIPMVNVVLQCFVFTLRILQFNGVIYPRLYFYH